MKESERRKTLAVIGSPHADGMSGKMLQIAVDACRTRGDEVTVLPLYEKNIQFCRGCRKCLDTRECIMKHDDMVEITKLVRESDLIITATPVYWANIPAVLKNFFDRLLGVAMEETLTFPRPRLSGKKYMLLVTCNTRKPFAWICGQLGGAIRAMREFFKTAGMDCVGVVTLGNTGAVREIPEHIKKKIISKVS